MENTLDISGLDKAAVLAALYNHARPQGMGYLHFTPEDMTLDEAQAIIDQMEERAPGRLYFDYVKGRVMKVDLSKDALRTALYDRDNGYGAARHALKHLLGHPADAD